MVYSKHEKGLNGFCSDLGRQKYVMKEEEQKTSSEKVIEYMNKICEIAKTAKKKQ